MSTITNVNLKIKFTDELPEEVVNWLVANQTVKGLEFVNFDYEVPEYIRLNAGRCEVLNHPENEDEYYAFNKVVGGYLLELESGHKNKDNDYEHMINCLIPYIDAEQSVGFISDDYDGSVYRILFTNSYDRAQLEKSLLRGPKDVGSGYDDSTMVDIDQTIESLEELYQENKND